MRNGSSSTASTRGTVVGGTYGAHCVVPNANARAIQPSSTRALTTGSVLQKRDPISELLQTDFSDFRLLAGGNAKFDAGIVGQALAQQAEHFAGALAGRTDDEDVSETLLVRRIFCLERMDDV